MRDDLALEAHIACGLLDAGEGRECAIRHACEIADAIRAERARRDAETREAYGPAPQPMHGESSPDYIARLRDWCIGELAK